MNRGPEIFVLLLILLVVASVAFIPLVVLAIGAIAMLPLVVVVIGVGAGIELMTWRRRRRKATATT